MTLTSLQQLTHFLNTHDLSGRIADFGGTENIGAEIITAMLSLSDITLEGDPNTTLGVNVRGNPKNNKVQYLPMDYDNGVDLLKPIKGKKFDGALCMDLLEHTSNPFLVVKNIKDSLKKGAYLFVTAPFVWELHSFPHDYWRFTPQWFEVLFEGMEVEIVYSFVDTYEHPDHNTFPPIPPVTLPYTRIIGIFKKR